jgi:hypothetical protein
MSIGNGTSGNLTGNTTSDATIRNARMACGSRKISAVIIPSNPPKRNRSTDPALPIPRKTRNHNGDGRLCGGAWGTTGCGITGGGFATGFLTAGFRLRVGLAGGICGGGYCITVGACGTVGFPAVGLRADFTTGCFCCFAAGCTCCKATGCFCWLASACSCCFARTAMNWNAVTGWMICCGFACFNSFLASACSCSMASAEWYRSAVTGWMTFCGLSSVFACLAVLPVPFVAADTFRRLPAPVVRFCVAATVRWLLFEFWAALRSTSNGMTCSCCGIIN